ncbi:MAG: radical SAM family enzyme [Saliniramus fredricksonii]|uniref:DNA repair photolyase n=2 Tax=Saliniramus fredricksonii TaxID=1653334 RepID=A0A0P7X3P0_9HYPH|nr:MAG: radical SAM family enzyme [Saliniramus fredricksonii]SCC80786.1 DNA repair photolyase [Saliniramus fredricksonii]
MKPNHLQHRDWRERLDQRIAPRPAPLDAGMRRGRGALTNETGRFERVTRETFDDSWDIPEEVAPLRTEVTHERPRTIITRNASPDLGFDRSVNPYRGCEHGCFYCFARPSHAYQGLSAGLDFETRLFAKPDAPALLERELAARGYSPRTIAIGTNTDPYQPIEKRMKITRGILEVLARTRHPVGIVTKSGLVTRDLDILGPMAEQGLVKVAISLTTLDPRLSRKMEPRAAAPGVRLETIRRLRAEGIPVSVLVAPVVPAINDHEIERLLDAAYEAGAREAGYVMLRLPHEVKALARDWLAEHFPQRAQHVMSLVQDMQGGKDYDSRWGVRQSGTGPIAWAIGRRFEIAANRLGFNAERVRLRTDLFCKPARSAPGQLALF